MLRLDHAVFAVGDLDAAAERWRRDHGLDSTPSGRHPGWGTANRIVPLGEAYLELIAAVEPGAAERSAFGRSVVSTAAGGGGWLAWVVRTDDLDGDAARLGLEVTRGRREREDGSVLGWRSAGLEDAKRTPSLPFFISWDVPLTGHPGRVRAGHGVRPAGLAGVAVAGDAARLARWLGGHELPVTVTEAPPEGVRSVTVATADGEIEIR